MNPALEQIPPQALDAEQAVLGCLMASSDRGLVDEVRSLLKPEDFYRPSHAEVYRVILALTEYGEPCDVLMVADMLERGGRLDHAGGRAYLMGCTQGDPRTGRLTAYANRVLQSALWRRLIEVGASIIGSAYEQTERPDEIAAEGERMLFALASRARAIKPQPFATTMPEAGDAIQASLNEGKRVPGVPTGFRGLDSMTGGLQPGDLVLVAGRPSMGKTALGMNVVLNAAKEGVHGLVFSLEMSARSLSYRLIALEAGVDSARLRVGDLRNDSDHGDEHADVMRTIAALSALPVWVDERGDRNLHEIRALSREWQHRHKVGLIVVDYADLMVRETPPDQVRHELGRISGGLKSLAKELELPVVLLCQLNRDSEKRANKRPQMSDLAECGMLERDADLILFPFRPMAYATDVEREEEPLENAEIIVGKHRNGATGSVDVTFVRRMASFADRREGA